MSPYLCRTIPGDLKLFYVVGSGLILFIIALLQASQVHAADKIVLQLRWTHQFQFAGYYAALEKGYYAHEGLDVDIREAGPNRPTPLEEVLQGHAQYGIGNSGLVVAYQQGKPVVALAAIFQRSPNIWLTLKQTGIHSPQDLAKKKLMMTRSVENAELLVMFANEGIKPSDLNIIPSSFNIMDLVDGKTDAFNAYSTNEPYLLKKNGIPYRIIDPHDYGVDFYSDVLFTSQNELDRHAQRVAAFRRASLEGWQYAMAHPEEIADLILKRYSSAKSREHLLFEADAIRNIMQPDLIEIGHMNPDRWIRIESAFADLGMTESHRSLDNFIYQPFKAEWRWLIWVVSGLAITTLVAGLIAIAYGRFNRKLKQEMADKENARTALIEANQIFLNVLDSVDVALYVTDAETLRVLFANASAREQFGEMLGYPRYQKLLDRPEPCDRCRLDTRPAKEASLPFIPPCADEELDFHYPVTDRWYHIAHRKVLWLDGCMVLVGAAVDITNRKQREDEKDWLANHDPLTKLPNRSLLADRMKSMLALAGRNQSLVAVLFLDLDDFKPVNDTYGHEVGDELLISLVRRLERCLRASDTMARLGGDEFVMVIAITDRDELREIINRLAHDLHQTFTLSKGIVNVDASIGIALYPDDADTPDALLRQADEAMYRIKHAGGGGFAMRESADSAMVISHWQN